MKLLRGILTLLIVTVYVGATMRRFAPSYASNADMNHAALGGMMQDRDEPSDKHQGLGAQKHGEQPLEGVAQRPAPGQPGGPKQGPKSGRSDKDASEQ